jgi:hypothetical protein
MLKSVMIAPAILVLLLSLAPAQSPWASTPTKLQLAQTSNSPVKEANHNAKLTDAASINEDLVGFALDGKADKVAERVTAMRNTLSSLRPLLSNSAFDGLGRQVTEMEQAFSKRDLLATALASVEAYRIIENAMDAASRPSPVEVAMLDYSGFKLSILGAAPVANWAAISTTAKESDGSWSTLANKIQEKSLQNLVSAIQEGLRNAVTRKDIDGVKFAAKMQLEAVDVLEDYFKRAGKRP